MTTLTQRWAIELIGEAANKETWSQWLTPPFDPFVEEVIDDRGNFLVMRSTEFNGKESVEQVRHTATGLLSALNVAMAIVADTDPLTFGTVVEFLENTPPRKHMITEVESFSMRLRPGSFAVKIVDAHGNEIQSPPSQSKARHWVRATYLKPLLGDALRCLEGKPGWIELYKAYEVISKLPNGGISSSEIRRFTQSANAGHRHHFSKYKPHKKPMELWEARAFITQWISAAFEEVE